MRYLAASLMALFVFAACAGPGGVSPRGGLMYQVPDVPALVYVTESSQDINIDAGAMGSMIMSASSEATLAMSFEEGTTDAVRVTATFQELSASLTQPMGGSLSATESDIEGDLVFTMDEKGRGEVVTLPEMKGSAEQLVTPVSFVHEFFPRLPGDVAEPGDTWTDTIQYDAETGQGEMSTSSVLNYTLVGDTVVDGRNLLLISYEGEAEVLGSAVTEGMEVLQSAAGDVTGTVLWDPQRGIMVAGESSQDLDGTVEVPAAGMPAMPMTVVGSGSVRLQGG